MKNTILLLILLISNFVVVSQTNRDPRSKDQANVFWDGTYTLYSLNSDEPILPNENGDYFFWATTNEDPTPKQVSLKKGKSLGVYKFITYNECVQFCNSIRKSKGIKLIEEKSSSINSKKELVYTSILNTSSKDWQTEFNQIKAQSIEFDLATKRIELYNTIIAKYDNESIKLNYYGKENAVKEYNSIREKTIFLISKKSIVKKILKSFDDVTKLLAAMYQIDIDKSVAYYVKDKNNLFGCAYVKYNGKWSCHQIYDNKKRNYLTKLIIKNQISPIDEQSKISVITSLTGLDEEYFNYVSKLNENKKMKENFVSNYTKVENIKYKYVGTFNSDGTKKWGILLDEDKDTLFVGKWENNFPSLENGKSFLYNNKENTVILEENGVVFKSYIGGKLFVGSMRDNGANGYGIALFNNGDRYVGNFLNGKYHGNGMLYKGGDRYVGNFQDGKKSGKGSITFPNGGGYVGEWKNDMYDGMGEYVTSYGKKSEGMFRQNELIKSKEELENEYVDLGIIEEESPITQSYKTSPTVSASKSSSNSSSTSSTSSFSCSFDFEHINTSGVTFTLIDNRKRCRKCNNYALYKTIIDDFQKLAVKQYQRDVIGYHIQSIMSDEKHYKFDVLRHPNTINYKSMLIYLNSENNEKNSISDETLFNDCAWLCHKNNKPSKVIKFDKYNITSEYCSSSCKQLDH